ncbi:MAG TPA: PilZ domain-containing protein [Arenimonas sp.]|uniref:PilZ domain-containing protein n=1 Tax=Arenimonas sp. TaxID=1872635 RepID=UPI002D1A34DB|nr:PilZ domain-containing protein [Arenimonas sp.]HMB56706.1 PilZ domain-containing protein [Arenimonas sp.]
MPFFERRRSPRMVEPGQVLVARGNTGFLVDLVDLSKGGACLKRPRGWSFNSGDAVLLHLLSGTGPTMCMEARILWHRDDEVGLEYI